MLDMPPAVALLRFAKESGEAKKSLVVLLFVLLVCSYTAQSQVIDPTTYPGADLCLKIQAAIAANAPTFPNGLIIDARSASGIQACSTNPFSGASVNGQLLLGMVVLQTTAPIVTPSTNAWQILGTSRGIDTFKGTTILAAATFPSGANLVRLGDGTNLTFGNRIENLTIDCNGVANSTGLYSTDIQEQSGASNVLIANCSKRGLWINASGTDGPHSVTNLADNYDFHDVEVDAGRGGTPSTIACEFDGNQQTQTEGPHIVDGLTCDGDPGNPIGTAFIFDGISSSHISNLNAEHATTGYLIGNVAPLRAVTIDTMRGAGITGDLVHVLNAVAPVTGNLIQGVALNNVINSDNGAAVTLQDDIQGNTLHDYTIGSYWIGAALPRFGGGYTHWSSAPSVAGIVPQLATDNGADAYNVLDIGSGNSASQGSLVEFEDRGIPKWNIGKEAFNNFQLYDVVGGVERIYEQAAGATSINSSGSGSILFNFSAGSGTGGITFGSGGSSPAATAAILSNGEGIFTNVALPALAPSSAPLCIGSGNVITNIGCGYTGESLARSAPSAAVPVTASVLSAFGRTGTVVAAQGDYDVSQITGAAPIHNPSFTGFLRAPSFGGTGNALASAGPAENVGSNASVSCAPDHMCDAFSGLFLVSTGSGPISNSGLTLSITMPSARDTLPNCIASVTGDKGLGVEAVVGYPDLSSITISLGIHLQPSVVYRLTYICGGT